MKNLRIVHVVALLAVVLVGIVPVLGGLSGSAHDFSGAEWSGGRLCLPCHTTHGADLSVVTAPLWNHEVTTATYTVYSSDTLNAQVGQPSGVSKLCLSCHDGTVAVDSFSGNTGQTMMTGSANIGTNLANSHPISFTYDTALATADGKLHDPAIQTTSLGGTIAEDLLFGSKMECASCHDVHNGGSAGGQGLLRITTDGSELCLTCHDI